MAVGMRRPDFPSNLGQQRAVMAVSAVLVAIAVAMAVATSGGSKDASEAKAAAPAAPATSTPSTPAAPAAPAEAPAGGATTSTQPTATTGTPPPASSPASAKPTKLALAADPGGQLAYDAKTLSAKAGTVTITMANMSPVEHDVAIAEGTKVLGQTPTFVGGSKTLTLKLKPGTYTFYCTVPGHRQAGMEGKLTVTA